MAIAHPHRSDAFYVKPLWVTLVHLLACVACVACSSSQEGSAAERAIARSGSPDPVRGDATHAPAAPEVEAPPEGTLARKVHDAARRYAAGWEVSADRFSGELAARAKQSFMLILRYGRCYRFIGAGGPSVEDLDLVLYDSADIPVQRDLARDDLPLLGLQAHICPHETATYRLDVHAYAGHGPFLVQVLESPH